MRKHRDIVAFIRGSAEQTSWSDERDCRRSHLGRQVEREPRANEHRLRTAAVGPAGATFIDDRSHMVKNAQSQLCERSASSHLATSSHSTAEEKARMWTELSQAVGRQKSEGRKRPVMLDTELVQTDIQDVTAPQAENHPNRSDGAAAQRSEVKPQSPVRAGTGTVPQRFREQRAGSLTRKISPRPSFGVFHETVEKARTPRGGGISPALSATVRESIRTPRGDIGVSSPLSILSPSTQRNRVSCDLDGYSSSVGRQTTQEDIEENGGIVPGTDIVVGKVSYVHERGTVHKVVTLGLTTSPRTPRFQSTLAPVQEEDEEWEQE
ncbi:hypothetical protein FVE85_0080 [Porphyridium purpureum]|uniref:Uncharacterized protein n=1 Tax=Porphyridium purpureum TaxID=35688 RepID=A0A5J4YXN7_PORPP|nr:hypothetical protein FVE85_0080 [Porphyridium purpureum]|eukprot:POR0889..scf208_2